MVTPPRRWVYRSSRLREVHNRLSNADVSTKWTDWRSVLKEEGYNQYGEIK
jgi:hypothetical protein